jgi:hypothetical protein
MTTPVTAAPRTPAANQARQQDTRDKLDRIRANATTVEIRLADRGGRC